LEAQGARSDAAAVRARSLEQAVAVPGTIDGNAFEWIADADARLGPSCELLIDGKYYWVPFERIERLQFEKPQDLRDLVWLPANLRLANGGEWAAFMPACYPGSQSDADAAIKMGRKTAWEPIGAEGYRGHGMRMFATDRDEYPLAGTSLIELHHPASHG
jgi:type VI secretion system protein ImpE